jgi:hypothetical protein
MNYILGRSGKIRGVLLNHTDKISWEPFIRKIRKDLVIEREVSFLVVFEEVEIDKKMIFFFGPCFGPNKDHLPCRWWVLLSSLPRDYVFWVIIYKLDSKFQRFLLFSHVLEPSNPNCDVIHLYVI